MGHSCGNQWFAYITLGDVYQLGEHVVLYINVEKSIVL